MKFSASVFAALVLSLATSTNAVVTNAEVQEKAATGLRLLSLELDVDPVWKTEEEKLDLIRAGVRFFDVTEIYDENEPFGSSSSDRFAAAAFAAPSHSAEVNPILATVSIPNMQSYLANLTAFNNRYYRASTGLDASTWIRDTVGAIAAQFTHVNATVAFFNHTWVEPSIIAKIPGTNASAPITILGAHMDSINGASPMTGRAPGADDDGSGTVNLIEAFRALLAAGFTPSTPVEFQWYAGEEGGLLGSGAIARAYKAANVSVNAMMQFDMTAFFTPGANETITMITDFVDPALTNFTKSLVDTYNSIPWDESECGYACSDHASWNRQGYPSAFPFETRFGEDNPRIHGTGDTVNVTGFSWTHSLEYAKLAVAFAYELGA